jgi:hypothetical protein
LTNLITKDYQGLAIQFTGDAWFNATIVAEKYKKRPVDWLKRDDVTRFVGRLCEIYKVSQNHFIKTKRGGDTTGSKVSQNHFAPGTWLHPKLGVKFAQWLDVDFEIWCSEQIDNLIRGELDVKRARHQAASSYKLMSDIVRLAREQVGKESKPYHYANEARLINWVLTGEFKGLDRDLLSYQQLARLALLEEKNSLLIASGTPYGARKVALQQDCKMLAAVH